MDLEEFRKKLEARQWWHWDNLRWVPYRRYDQVKDLYMEVKFGFQRMFRGYDDSAVWALDSYLTPTILPVLKQMRADNWGLPYSEELGRTFTEAEWNEILDKMIFSFQYIYDEYHMVGRFEDGAETVKYWLENKDKINEGLMLFGKHFQSLWT